MACHVNHPGIGFWPGRWTPYSINTEKGSTFANRYAGVLSGGSVRGNITWLSVVMIWRDLENTLGDYTWLHNHLDEIHAFCNTHGLGFGFQMTDQQFGSYDVDDTPRMTPTYIYNDTTTYPGDARGDPWESNCGGGMFFEAEEQTDLFGGDLRRRYVLVDDGSQDAIQARVAALMSEVAIYTNAQGYADQLCWLTACGETSMGHGSIYQGNGGTRPRWDEVLNAHLNINAPIRVACDANGCGKTLVVVSHNWWAGSGPPEKGPLFQTEILDVLWASGITCGIRDPNIFLSTEETHNKWQVYDFWRKHNGETGGVAYGDWMVHQMDDKVNGGYYPVTDFIDFFNGELVTRDNRYLRSDVYTNLTDRPLIGCTHFQVMWRDAYSAEYNDMRDNYSLLHQRECQQYPDTGAQPAPSAPIFSPPGGSWSPSVSVTIIPDHVADTTYYTIDGTEPSSTNGTLYTVPAVFSSIGGHTLRAISYRGVEPSPIQSAQYVISEVLGGGGFDPDVPRTSILKIPTQSKATLTKDASDALASDYTFYFQGETSLPLASFEDPQVTIDPGSYYYNDTPDISVDPNGEGNEMFWDIGGNRNASVEFSPVLKRPYTALVVARHPGATITGSKGIFAIGKKDPEDWASIWVENADQYGYGQQESKGNGRAAWNVAKKVEHEQNRYRVAVLVGDDVADDVHGYIANDDDAGFTSLGSMSEQFSDPLTDWDVEHIILGAAKADSGEPQWRNGYQNILLIWENKALSSTELDTLFTDTYGLLRFLGTSEGDLPTVRAPIIDPPGGVALGELTVKITTADPSETAVTYYSTDGTTPSELHPTIPDDGEISIGIGTTTVRATTFDTPAYSETASHTYDVSSEIAGAKPDENLRIISDIWSDAGTVSASSEAGNMVAENVQSSPTEIPWRSTTTYTQVLTGDFLSTQPVDALCLYGHSFSPTAVLKFYLSNESDFFSPIYAAALAAGSIRWGLGEGPLGTSGLGGYESQDVGYAQHLLHWLDEALLARYWRITITDTQNPDGFIQIGRVLVGKYWAPINNMVWGYELGPQDDTELRRTRGGSLRSIARPSHRSASVSLDWLSEVEEGALHDMFLRAGKRLDLLFSGYPQRGDAQERRHTVLCRMTKYGRPRRDRFGRSVKIDIQEV